MFDLFRSRAKVVRIMLGGLLLLVALSMVTYLIPGGGMDSGASSTVVAEIGKEALGLVEVQQIVQGQLRNQNIPREMAAVFVPQIANQMITEYAVAYQAERMGFRVSEADIVNTIRTMIPQLFNGDQFVGREAYAAMLAQQNMTIPQFESRLRKQLLTDALRRMVSESVTVSPQDLAREFHARNDKVKVEYVAISQAKYQAEVKVQPEEIRAQYSADRGRYSIPEKRSLEVIFADQARLAQSLTVPDADLRRAYERNKDSYRLPDRVHVRHILLKTAEAAKDQVPKIQAKAEDLLKQLKAGADFAALAKKNSEDTVSAAKGGDLDWVMRGQTVKAFEDAAFSLKPNELSGIIKTEYGFHILQVLEKQNAHVQPFEEVKAQLAEEQKKQMVFDRMQSLSDQGRAALAKAPGAAERIAAELGLQFARADKLGAGDQIPGIGASPELYESLGSLRKGEVTPVVQIGPTRLAVAVVTDIQPARQAELSEVEGQIGVQLSRDKLTKLLVQKANELAARAKSLNGDLKKAAQGMGLEVKTPPEFTRDGAVEGLGTAGYLTEAMQAPVGEVLGPVVVNELQTVYKVVARIPADESRLAQERASLLEQIRTNQGRTRLEVFEESLLQRLVKEGKVKINKDVINRLVSSYSGS